MKKIHVVFHDAGGGHRNAAVALQTVIAQQNRPWQVDLIQFQSLSDRLDVLRQLTGIRIEEQYNAILRNGWTLGSAQLLKVLQATIHLFHGAIVKLLTKYWRDNPADLLISVIPHFNSQLYESWSAVYPERPFVTLITDLADYPPHFWIEPVIGHGNQQYIIAGTERAVEQARSAGHPASNVFGTSGMILRPDFYEKDDTDPVALRAELGLKPDLPTGIVLFGGFGSKVMYDIADQLEKAQLPVQLILVCGRNEKLAARMHAREWKMPVHIIGFTKEVHKLMRAADFLIGKPGPGSIAEAMVRQLPVLIECNAWTLPQERYNTEWVRGKRVGVVLKNFREVVAGVKQMTDPGTLAEFRQNVAKQNNRAVFEIAEILSKLLGEAPGKATQESDPVRLANSRFD